MAKDKLICNCNRTMPLDGKAIARALKMDGTPQVQSELCRRHLAAFEAAVKNGNDLVVACTQEAPLFSELHGELKAIMAMPDTRQQIDKIGLVPVTSGSVPELQAFVKSEIVRWGEVVRKAGAVIE